MPMIVVSGPEKAGKTRFCGLLEDYWIQNFGPGTVHRRSWHHKDRDPEDRRDTRNLAALVGDSQIAQKKDQLVIWDRSYICESVYGLLLGRPSDLADNLLLGEWLYGRAIQSLGESVILLPESSAWLKQLRTADDHPISPELEIFAYKNYAQSNRLRVLTNDYATGTLEEYADETLQDLIAHSRTDFRPFPPGYAGPRDAEVVVVGDSWEAQAFKGEWLPLSHKGGFRLAEALFEIDRVHPLSIGWCTARQCPPNLLRKVTTLIALSDEAGQWCRHYTGCKDVVTITSGLHTSPSRQNIAHSIAQAVADAEAVRV